MKELDSFTVEEIEEIISSCQQEIHNTPTSDEFPVSPRVLLSLARIALAAKRAEPVINIKFKDGWPVPESVGVVDGGQKLADGYHDFYTTPQLNSQFPLSRWINCIDQMPEDDTLCLGADEYGVIWTMHFDDGEFRADTGWYPDLNVTHWMPLPDSPEKP